MTILLTSTVVVLGPSAADNNACAGTMLPIKLFHRECRPLQPWKLTQIAAHSSRAPAVRPKNRLPVADANLAPTATATSIGHYPHSA
jgi:hypothetical protein